MAGKRKQATGQKCCLSLHQLHFCFFFFYFFYLTKILRELNDQLQLPQMTERPKHVKRMINPKWAKETAMDLFI